MVVADQMKGSGFVRKLEMCVRGDICWFWERIFGVTIYGRIAWWLMRKKLVVLFDFL